MVTVIYITSAFNLHQFNAVCTNLSTAEFCTGLFFSLDDRRRNIDELPYGKYSSICQHPMEGENMGRASSMIVAITIKTRETFNAYSVLSEHSYRSCLLELLNDT
ncbi:uncharacterized protein LOC122576643 [Bombus pyrosoma]|uniref:uncharacterized protein LOC122576643 n=1 Tax=Bombus pyrosoma TaxID=396416 RepID=UPI001CB91292|nr:uncharacterized protein LOC122576643 [Bombus pyrosoma]